MAFLPSELEKPYWQVEDEDLEATIGEYEIQWEGGSQETFRKYASHLVIATGIHATSFFQECLSKQLAATVSVKREQPSEEFGMGLRPRKLKPALLYNLNSNESQNLWLLVNSPDLPNDLHYQLGLDLVVPENPNFSVVVFASAPLVEYITKLTEEELADPLSRCLKTTAWSLQTPYPLLEGPNLTAGLGAAFLNRCQYEKLPALLTVTYTQNRNADSHVSQVFRKVIQSIPALSNISWPSALKARYDDPTGNMYV